MALTVELKAKQKAPFHKELEKGSSKQKLCK